jgi:hypothetical protein
VRKEKYCVELIFVYRAINMFTECRFEMGLFKDCSKLKQVMPRILKTDFYIFYFLINNYKCAPGNVGSQSVAQ